jgi:hypothetical protein
MLLLLPLMSMCLVHLRSELDAAGRGRAYALQPPLLRSSNVIASDVQLDQRSIIL